MLTIDAQVHAYEHNHPGRPWVGTLTGPAEVTGDQMVAAMDAVGVDGAILVYLRRITVAIEQLTDTTGLLNS